MAYQKYLIFNGTEMQLPTEYEVSKSDLESDGGGRTEAGTTRRDIIREGVPHITVTMQCSKKSLLVLAVYKKLASIAVGYYDPDTCTTVNDAMYITGYKVKLVKDTSYGGLWTVSFELEDLGEA